MIEFGKTLREAREAKGYSISQIAEITHMLPSIVQNLEDEDFSKIVAPIYGRGFVKLYCETVGIEAKPLVNEFMDIYNGNRTPDIKERPTAIQAKPAEPPESAEPITAAEPPMARAESLFQSIDQTRGQTRAQVPPPPASEPDLFNQPPEAESSEPRNPRPYSRYAAPAEAFPERPKATFKMPSFKMPAVKMPTVNVPPSFWRIMMIVIVLLALVAAIGYGIVALYHATSGTPPTQKDDATAFAPVQAPATAPKPVASVRSRSATSRTPQKIPSLYVD